MKLTEQLAAADNAHAIERLAEEVAAIRDLLIRLSHADRPPKERSHAANGGATSPPIFGWDEPSPANDQSEIVSPAEALRRIIKARRARAKFFDPELFSDPAWDMLLDLAAARQAHERVSVTSLCIAANVPVTTALRRIGQMCEAGLIVRTEDRADRRRNFVALSEEAAKAMAAYFAEVGRLHG